MFLGKLLSFLDPEQVISLKLNRMKISVPSTFISELDENKIEFISQNTRKGGAILEFGAGGSTLELLKRGYLVTSIESDKYFAHNLNAVAMNLFECSPVIHCNIGPTGNYGFPARHLHLYNRLRGRYRNYVNQVQKYPCDTIIIDGRFRVATFLTAAIYLQAKPTMILIDDYKNRTEYHALEEVIGFDGEIGNLAYYYTSSIKDLNAAYSLLSLHLRDPR